MEYLILILSLIVASGIVYIYIDDKKIHEGKIPFK